MFDIGFSELLVVAVVALLVLGPERLPKATRFAGLWVRRARAQWYSVKDELERELAADELKRSLKNAQDQLRSAGEDLRTVGTDLRNAGAQAQQGVEELQRSILDTGSAATANADSRVDETIATETSPAETLSADHENSDAEPRPSFPAANAREAASEPTPLPDVGSLAKPTLMPTNDADQAQQAAGTGTAAQGNAVISDEQLKHPQAAPAQTPSTEDSSNG